MAVPLAPAILGEVKTWARGGFLIPLARLLGVRSLRLL
jgi:hypothetical protein